jgi:hypothetical protein
VCIRFIIDKEQACEIRGENEGGNECPDWCTAIADSVW